MCPELLGVCPELLAVPPGAAPSGCSCAGPHRAGDWGRWGSRLAVPPSIEPSVVDLSVLENGTVALECLASGLPAPGASISNPGCCPCAPGAVPMERGAAASPPTARALLPCSHRLVQGAGAALGCSRLGAVQGREAAADPPCPALPRRQLPLPGLQRGRCHRALVQPAGDR